MLHIELSVKNATGKPWIEEYALPDGTDIKQWASDTIDHFNETRYKKYDRARILVGVKEVPEPADYDPDEEL